MTRPLSRTAPNVMRSSVEMTGITELPSGMRATREKRKIAASKLLKKVRAPAKKKLPASVQACNMLQKLQQYKHAHTATVASVEEVINEIPNCIAVDNVVQSQEL